MPGFAGCSNRLALAAFAAGLAAAPTGALSVEERFHLLQSETVRIETVFYRLARAAAPFCRNRVPQLGLVLHHRAQYRPEVRDEAARIFGLGDAAAVLAVAPGGPADRAGLIAGDAILAVNGAPLPAFPPGTVQGNAGRLSGEALDRAVAKGPATITVRRGDVKSSLTLVAESGCAATVTLEPSQALKAQSGGGRVLVTTALVEFTRSDDELAFLIGHELAHLAAGETRGRNAEVDADIAGLRFARAEGYDPCVAPGVLRRLADARRQSLRIDFDHPAIHRRTDALRAEGHGACPIDDD
jgi:membrane-associated protease RseP (regulator of RpoE activity)